MKLNTIGYFEIQSSNPEREKQFYSSLFGWTFTKDDNIQVEYYRIETNSINGGLLKRPTKVPPTEPGTNAFVCSVQVEDFDKTSEMIIKLGGQVALPKFAVTGRCWQGYFLDQDNNNFGIFEVDLNAR
ncbi:MAG TPA: VOC family protein [Sphingobacteriaceae bacterium]